MFVDIGRRVGSDQADVIASGSEGSRISGLDGVSFHLCVAVHCMPLWWFIMDMDGDEDMHPSLDHKDLMRLCHGV